MLPPDIQPCLQGVIPSQIATVARDGTPNVTAISQVYYVDDRHVALSNQFFSKTQKNLAENPYAFVQVIHPGTARMWFLELRYLRSETEGPVFDSMDMQLEAIASAQGMSHVFRLKSADLYEVLGVREAREASA
jgi:hypothetical protein